MSLNLTVKNISKSYDGKEILSNCSFSFLAGSSYAIMGHNGSGKSTFLRICSLLEMPDTGNVEYSSGNGILKNDIDLKRRITLVLPKVGVFNTTVFKNIAYGLKIRGMITADIEEKTHRMLEFVGLLGKENHNALTLSSGEAQRLGMARAMVIEPDMIFLDEPTAFIDKKNTEIIEEIISNMKKQIGTTIIFATHDRPQAERLSENIVLMSEGTFL